MRNDAVRSAVAVTGAFLLVLAMGTLGWAMLRGDSGAATATWKEAAGVASGTPTLTATPDAEPTTAAPTPSATPSPTKKKVVAKPTATKKPPARERPPASLPKPTIDPTCKPTYSGTNASNADVKAALVTAANRQYWVGATPPAELTVALPTITVPANLMKAVAWQESGWQSTIIACDGGVGVMQITPSTPGREGTDAQVNHRFGENFNVNTLSGNASIGAAYIEWLIMYFGLFYFEQSFDLSTVGPVGPKGAQLALLDVVLAAYNVGPGTLEVQDPTTKVWYLKMTTTGQAYANNVKALRTSCPCQSY